MVAPEARGTTPDVPRQLPRWRPDLGYTWVLGDFAVRALLRDAPERALEVRLHRDADARLRADLAAACEAAGVPLRRDDAAVEAKRSKANATVLALLRSDDDALDPTAPQVALVRPREAGNVGTALRTAVALGVRDVAVIGGIDPRSPHVLRASLGTAFAARVARPASLAAWADAARRTSGAPPLLLHGGAARSLRDLAPGGGAPLRLAVGPEWPGFDAADLAHGTPARIDVDPDAESLNVAVALGIALHHLGAGPAR